MQDIARPRRSLIRAWISTLPDPDHLTLNETLWIVRTQANIREAIALPSPLSLQHAWSILDFHIDLSDQPEPSPAAITELLKRAWGSLYEILLDAPGFTTFKAWRDKETELYDKPEMDALDKIIRTLMERLGKGAAEVEGMPLAEAMLLLPIPQKSWAGRLSIDPSEKTVTLDGQVGTIKTTKALQAFQMIADANGGVISSNEIRDRVPGLRECHRIDTMLDRHLPDWVRALVVGVKGNSGGFFLELPKVVRNGALKKRNLTLKY
jgi:hypothetical protein